MPTTPSPECPMRNRDHAEHIFTVFGTMTNMDGAHVDCPGRSARRDAWEHIKRDYADHGHLSATDLAAAYLRNRVITPTDYLRLVRWSEGRA